MAALESLWSRFAELLRNSSRRSHGHKKVKDRLGTFCQTGPRQGANKDRQARCLNITAAQKALIVGFRRCTSHRSSFTAPNRSRGRKPNPAAASAWPSILETAWWAGVPPSSAGEALVRFFCALYPPSLCALYLVSPQATPPWPHHSGQLFSGTQISTGPLISCQIVVLVVAVVSSAQPSAQRQMSRCPATGHRK